MEDRRVVLEPIDEALAEPVRAATRTALEPVAEEPAQAAPEAPASARRARSGLLIGGIGLVALLLLAQMLLGLWRLAQDYPLLGAGWALALALLLGVAGNALWRFWRTLARLRGRDALHRQARFLLDHDGVSEGVAFCTRLAELSGDSGSASFQRWRTALSATHNDREVLALYSQTVLVEADERALAQVVRHAGDVSVMLALSRFPLVDMLFVLWRQLRLAEDVARAYGVDAGYWGRVRLLRAIVRNMALAGASEVAAEVGTQLAGAGVIGKLSTAAAQGIGAGILTARLGLRAMAACRAIPWREDERPRLARVSAGMLANVRRYLGADDEDRERGGRSR
ncbi:MAG: hypothetical protein CALGDGBN_02390 [Pseudomonadales bacterium]|nr:hypothetical protein [Pseudomonadales bacterium]